MAFQVKAGSFTKSTGGAPASQAITGVGFTPKCLILFTACGLTSGSFVAGIRAAIGFCTTTGDERSVSVSSEDAALNSNCSRRTAGKALTIVQWSEALVAECDLTSFDADGFTLSWSTNDANAYIIHYLALGGADLTNAAVIEWQLNAGTGNKAITGAGFQPDIVLHLHGGNVATAPAVSSAGGIWGLGAMDAGGQWATTITLVDNQATSDTQRHMQTDSCILSVNPSLALIFEASFVSLDADGFTTNLTTASGTAARVFSLCLKGGQYDVGSFVKDTGGAPDSQSITGPGFSPVALLFATIANIVTASAVANGRMGLGATDGTAEEAFAIQDADAQLVASCDAVDSTAKCMIKVNNDTPAVDAEADITSLDATGATFSWSTNDAVATEFGYVAFGSSAAAGGAPPGSLALLGVGR